MIKLLKYIVILRFSKSIEFKKEDKKNEMDETVSIGDDSSWRRRGSGGSVFVASWQRWLKESNEISPIKAESMRQSVS